MRFLLCFTVKMWQYVCGAEKDSASEIQSSKSLAKTSTLLTIPSKHDELSCVEEYRNHLTPAVNASIRTMDRRELTFLLIALVEACFGWLMAVVAAGTDQWAIVDDKVHEDKMTGLFSCSDCSAWMMATQAMIILGVLAASLGIGLIGLTLALMGGEPWIPLAGAGGCLVGGFFTLLGNIIYGASSGIGCLQGSFYISTIGGIMFVTAGILEFANAIR